jgi:hypothetical protein
MLHTAASSGFYFGEEHRLSPARFLSMDREQKRPMSDALNSLVWALGGCALAVLMIAFVVLSAPRKAPRLNTTPGTTTGNRF